MGVDGGVALALLAAIFQIEHLYGAGLAMVDADGFAFVHRVQIGEGLLDLGTLFQDQAGDTFGQAAFITHATERGGNIADHCALRSQVQMPPIVDVGFDGLGQGR